jgi:stage II sporulation protein D
MAPEERRHGQVVRQGSAKPSFPGSNPGGASPLYFLGRLLRQSAPKEFSSMLTTSRSGWALLACIFSVCAVPRSPLTRPVESNRQVDIVTLDKTSADESASAALPNSRHIIAVRLMEGAEQVVFSSRSAITLHSATHEPIELGPQQPWTLRLKSGTPSQLRTFVQVDEVPLAESQQLQEKRSLWQSRGVKLKAVELGKAYAFGTVAIDTRRTVLLVDTAPEDDASIQSLQASLLSRFAVRTQVFLQLQKPSAVAMELSNAFQQSIAVFEGGVSLVSKERQPIEVKRVEYGVGYDFHNFEDRSFRGDLTVTGDRDGRLAVVNNVELEDLLKGLVPSEIFAKAHPEALKAQAVTARSEVLAKLGTKHLVDPYLLCSEQHCAVYKGISAERPSTNQAVDETRGEVLFSSDQKLVDTVYSATCGGHTESNEFAWGTPPNAHLRGKPDLLPAALGTMATVSLNAMLDQSAPFACRLSSFSQPTKQRWERRFTHAEMNERLKDLNLGPLKALVVVERGVSHRATIVTLSGEKAATSIRGELSIRQRFGNLQSSMFEVSTERNAKGETIAWIFRGAGWGHGVGMCQMGAIGRAEAGQNYREILEHYFSAAKVVRAYQ